MFHWQSDLTLSALVEQCQCVRGVNCKFSLAGLYPFVNSCLSLWIDILHLRDCLVRSTLWTLRKHDSSNQVNFLLHGPPSSDAHVPVIESFCGALRVGFHGTELVRSLPPIRAPMCWLVPGSGGVASDTLWLHQHHAVELYPNWSVAYRRNNRGTSHHRVQRKNGLAFLFCREYRYLLKHTSG